MVERALQRGAQFGVERQDLGQGAVAVYALGQRLCAHRQLALEDFAFAQQCLAPRQPADAEHAQQHACNQDDNGPGGAAAKVWKHPFSVPSIAAICLQPGLCQGCADSYFYVENRVFP